MKKSPTKPTPTTPRKTAKKKDLTVKVQSKIRAGIHGEGCD